jgi:hypothetical protein
MCFALLGYRRRYFPYRKLCQGDGALRPLTVKSSVHLGPYGILARDSERRLPWLPCSAVSSVFSRQWWNELDFLHTAWSKGDGVRRAGNRF